MASVAELQAKAKDLQEASLRLARELRELERTGDGSAKMLGATPRMKSISLRVLALCGDDAKAAVKYLQLKGRHADVIDVQSWHSGLSEEARKSLLAPADDKPAALRELAEARKFVTEKGLVDWVDDLNKKKKVAPTPGSVIDHGPTAVRFRGHRSSRYRRLKRIMGRWGGRKGTFSIGDELTPEAFERKVGCLFCV